MENIEEDLMLEEPAYTDEEKFLRHRERSPAYRSVRLFYLPPFCRYSGALWQIAAHTGGFRRILIEYAISIEKSINKFYILSPAVR